MSVGERVRTQGQQGHFFDVWRSWRDFCKDTYEAKLLGVHVGNVSSGLDAGNVNTDAKMSIVGFGDAYE